MSDMAAELERSSTVNFENRMREHRRLNQEREIWPIDDLPWAKGEEKRFFFESDPNGLKASDPGAKLDSGKTRCHLVMSGFANALMEVSRVGTYGAEKYSPRGWEKVENGVERYADAMMRHELREAGGEDFDPDTGLLHAAHAAWNALAKLELMCRERR